MRRSRASLVPLTLAALMASSITGLASAQTLPAPVRSLSIAALPLGQALNELARQAGLQMLFPPALVAGKTAPAISGALTPEQAVDRLLAGSGLTATYQGDTVVVKAISEVSGTTTLAPVVVTASLEREQAAGPFHGYAATRSASGTKTDTPIIETPQSISVVGAEEISALKSQTLTEALGYTAGVFRSEGNDRTADRLYLRGFAADTIEGSLYRDGMRYMVNAFNGKQEPYGLERIEVLKGAASVLYGQSAPGGIINTVTKRPTADMVREAGIELGSYRRKQANLDIGGAIAPDSDWSYRLTAMKRDSDTFVDFVPDDRLYLAPALKWQPSAATSLTLLSHYQKSKSKYVFGLPSEGTILPNPNGRIPVGRYIGEPDRDYYDNTIRSLGYLFEHAFNDRLKVRNNVSLFGSRTSMPATWPMGDLYADARKRSISRFAESTREDKSSSAIVDLSLEYKWDIGSITNTSLVGVDHSSQRHQSERWLRFPADLDIYDPVYGVPYQNAAFMRNYPASRKERHRLTGLYFQNQSKLSDKWVVVVGGRQDWASRALAPLVGQQAWDEEKSDAFSGRAGVVYLADNGLAPFASWSQSFQPQAGADRRGNRFQPTKGNQLEVGVRYQPTGRNMMLSAALYDLTRTNVTTTDPVDNAYQVQTGEMRSRGLELEARGDVNRALSVAAAYSYTDSRTVRSNVPAEVGRQTGAVPRNQASVWGQVNFGALDLPGLKAGLGVRYVGATRGTYIDVRAPAFTLLDAMVSYQKGPWLYSLNAYNLTDRTHVTNCIDVCYYGEPRRLIASATYRW